MMRILHLISSEGFYGAESVVSALVRELQRAGHWVRIGVFENQHLPNQVAEQFESRGAAVIRIPCRGRFDLGVVKQIRELVRRENLTILHSHGYKADIYTYLAARKLELPLVSTSHLWTGATSSVRFYEFLDAVVLRRFHAVAAVSETVAKELCRAGVPAAKVTVIDNGIDFTQFAGAVPVLDGELNKKGRLLLGTVGRLVHQKGLTYFLRAARELLQEFPDLMFAVVGEGPERESLQQLARDLQIERQVFFTGARKDMASIYASLDIFILASVDEGMPMVLLEALASRLPVVATNVGAVSKIIVSEETGLLAQPASPTELAQAVRRLIGDSALRERLAMAGQRRVYERFSSAAMARKYLSVYGQLPGQQSPALTSATLADSGA